tara:strand:- start:178 stop:2457 length:2280 start_codon:yes stop_codon:yes gene_type:complete
MADEYINIKYNNGRLFPSWVLLNFKKYQLPEYIQKHGEDPCQMKKTKLELRKYQDFLSKFLDYKSPYKSALVYHGLGSGKTVTAINVYNMLYNNNPDWNVFILIPASLKKDPWEKDLNVWLSSKDKKERFDNIRFIHYDSPYADKNFLDQVKQADSSKNNIYIFDETHNFIKNVYNNIISTTGQRAYTIYNYIKQQKIDDNNTRIILLTGTPAVNTPYEIALLFNLLRPGAFPESESKFNEIFIENNSLSNKTKNMFQRRIMGLVSYYAGASKDFFASKKIYYRNIEMSPYQQDVYLHFEEIERKLEAKNTSKQGSTVYKSFTRQSSNFVFPPMTEKLKGDTRPRPSNFKISEKDHEKIMEGKKEGDKKDEEGQYIVEYNDLIQLYLNEFNKYLEKIFMRDKKNNKSLEKDFNVYKNKYNGNFKEFYSKYKEKSLLLEKLYECSCKMVAIIFKLIKAKGPVIVYSNYVKMEGLDIFKIYLKYFGFINYNKGTKEDFTYTEFHGAIKNREERENNRKVFNDNKNIYGKLIKIILISPAGSEGISLLNVREVHILEPYWNEVRISQLIGRAIRMCGHKDLPIKERYVDIYRYKAVRKDEQLTTDQKIENGAFRKNKLINSFLTPMKQVAIDCELFKNGNMLEEKYECFKFNQPKLFENIAGPVYNINFDLDKNLDNGLNSSNSVIKKIKVKKVQAVNKISDDNYSSKLDYWLDEDTYIIYDYDLKFAIGKLKLSIYNIPEKLDKYTFIIGQTINIPKLKYL